MNGLHVVRVLVASAILASITDWIFFGVLFHDRYGRTPGVWRQYRDKRDEMICIGVSQALMSVSSLIFIVVCAHLGLVSVASTLLAAVAVWLMVPVPLLASNAIFIPMDRWIVLSHSMGWLSRFMITALCISWVPLGNI